MHDSQAEPCNVYRATSLEGTEPHGIVEGIHAGIAAFADLQPHFQDWQSAAKFYANLTSKRFQTSAAATECELCGMQAETRPFQFLFRVFLDRQWGKKVVKGLLMIPILIFALASSIIILPLSSRRSGIRLVLPTFHNVCKHCRSVLRFRASLAYLFGGLLTGLKFILLVAAFFGITGMIAVLVIAISDEEVSWADALLYLLICLSPIPVLLLTHFLGERVQRWLRFPQELRHIATGPFKYIPIKDSRITAPLVLVD